MNQPLCPRFGFDAETIAERLRMTGLSGPDSAELAHDLQYCVVRPNISEIIDSFYSTLGCNPQFEEIVRQHSDPGKLKQTQRRYLLSIGQNIDTPQYFEERLRIGAAHQRVGVSLSLYLCAYRLLQSLLIDNIPQELKSDPGALQSMVQFIIKITALDMSLAIETYYTDKIVTLQRSIDSMRGEGEVLRRSLQTDSLTNLCSRNYSIQVLKEALTTFQQKGCPVSLVMADLDHFKDVNDRYGHLIGDRVLAAVAGRMSFDFRECDTIGRYGGEEFIIILKDTELADARQVAERIRMKVGSDPIHVADVSVPVTMSMGVAEACNQDDAQALATRADRALYAAKAAGRNRVEVADVEGPPCRTENARTNRQPSEESA